MTPISGRRYLEYIYIYDIYIYDFKQCETIISFGNYTGKISVNEAEMDQTKLLDNIAHTFDSVSALYEGREFTLTLNDFRSGVFPIKERKKTAKNITI